MLKKVKEEMNSKEKKKENKISLKDDGFQMI